MLSKLSNSKVKNNLGISRCSKNHPSAFTSIFAGLIFGLVFLSPSGGTGQNLPYENASTGQNAMDTIHKKRLTWAIIAGSTSYAITSFTLYDAWYKQYPRSGFHFYDDLMEWEQMDKMGHVYGGYIQTNLVYHMAKWTGLNEKKSMLTGAVSALVFQTTIEMMDGFSTDWGFSWSDFSANLLGIGSFVWQQSRWGEQRIRWKYSLGPRSYPLGSVSGMDPETRASDLFGNNVLPRLIKDYNTHTVWLSVNPSSFQAETWLPKWLNIAVGYGADNMFGGFNNTWVRDGIQFDAFEEAYPRHRQFYLSLDVDFDKIDTENVVLRTLFDILNLLKVPFSTLEFNTLGQVRFRLIHF